MTKYLKILFIAVLVYGIYNVFMINCFALTVNNLPNTIKPPKYATVTYNLKAYHNGKILDNCFWVVKETDATGFWLSENGELSVDNTLNGTFITLKFLAGMKI